jgi:hypothetical protein
MPPMTFSSSMTEPGHPWVNDDRQRVLVRRADVDEVDVQPVDLGDEVRQGARASPHPRLFRKAPQATLLRMFVSAESR